MGDHAGRLIPRALGALGLEGPDLERHIAWDIGVYALGRVLARDLDAPFVHQIYSRLVIDCNRKLDDPSLMPTVSDGSLIPGNLGLAPEHRALRIKEIHQPYHAQIASMLTAPQRRSTQAVLVSLHSFTPSLDGFDRPWRYGVLHRNDSSFASAVLRRLQAAAPGEVGDNQPYAMDGVDFTIPHHADRHGLAYVEIEMRQDILQTAEGQAEARSLLGSALRDALSETTASASPRAP